MDGIAHLYDSAAAELGPEDPITQSLAIRVKKARIAQEYRRRREKGEEKRELLFKLAEKYHYSWQSIRVIVYSY